MTADSETQMAFDIAAFVNGQLDAERRFAVASYLACHPERAANVMADLRLTEGLRLVFGSVETPPTQDLRLAAARLDRTLNKERRRRRWTLYAAAIAMFAVGWSAHLAYVRHDPDARLSDLTDVLEAALDAQDAETLRRSLVDELGPIPKDAVEVSRRLGIALPEFPDSWSILGAQIVATPERPGLAVMMKTPELGEIMLFGVLRSVDGPDDPVDAIRRRGRALAFFERDSAAYVLVDPSGPVSALRRGAEELRLGLN